MIIVVRSVFNDVIKYYLHVFLDSCLHKFGGQDIMLEYDKTDVSEGINTNGAMA